MDIKCKFIDSGFVNIGRRYFCEVESKSLSTQSKVKSFTGFHHAGKNNENVEALWFHDCPGEFFVPRSIDKIFANLVGISIGNCKLKSISAKDFRGLKYMRHLHLYDNELTSLPVNLFEHTKALEYFSTKGNPLTSLSVRMFNQIPEKQWKRIGLDIEGAHKVDFLFEPGTRKALQTFREFKEAVRAEFGFATTCIDMSKLQGESEEGFNVLWRQRKFSDFTIVAGAKEFPVHKAVLAVRSPAFALLLENDEDVKTTNKVEIKDCSEATVEEFLRCLYTGELNEDNDDSKLDLFSLACTFEVASLREVSEELVLDSINKENAFKAFTLGNLYKSEEIIDAAFEVIKEAYPEGKFSEALKSEPHHVKGIIDAIETMKLAVEKFNSLGKK